MQTFKQHLNEIGNSGQKPYRYKFIKDSANQKEAHFKGKENLTYQVAFWFKRNKPRLEVVFQTDEKGEHLTNFGIKEALKVMSTVVAITKEAVQQLRAEGKTVDELMFESSKWGTDAKDLDNTKAAKQRQKLYIAFAKKELGANKVKILGDYVYMDIREK